MLKTGRVLLRVLGMAGLMIIFIGLYTISLIARPHTVDRAFRLRRKYVRIAIRIFGIQVEKTGRSHDGVALYISNHRSFTDPIITANYVDAFVIAKAEVARMPIISKGAELTGVIYVKRDDKQSRRMAREALINRLQQGHNVLVYPEGTVGANKTTLRFKTGTFQEAARMKIPIVPIAIEYKSELDLWEDRSFLQQIFRQFGKKQTHVRIRIGSALNSDNPTILIRETKEYIDRNLSDMQVDWSEKFGLANLSLG